MSASRSSSRRSRTVLLAVLALLAAAALALLGLYAFIRAKAGALQAGAAFTFDYTVTSTSPEPSTAYAVLDALDALTGSVTGQSSGDSLYLAWYNVGSAAFQSDQAPGPDQAFTDLYVKDGLVYLNVRQIYRTLLSGLSAQYPVITSLIPDWGLGGLYHPDPADPAAGRRTRRRGDGAVFGGGLCPRPNAAGPARGARWMATSTLPPRIPAAPKSSSASRRAASLPSFSPATFWWSCPARASTLS